MVIRDPTSPDPNKTMWKLSFPWKPIWRFNSLHIYIFWKHALNHCWITSRRMYQALNALDSKHVFDIVLIKSGFFPTCWLMETIKNERIICDFQTDHCPERKDIRGTSIITLGFSWSLRVSAQREDDFVVLVLSSKQVYFYKDRSRNKEVTFVGNGCLQTVCPLWSGHWQTSK